ncbi:MAG: T9SS type A sorting domain-containing protein, partial [Sphingobacteriales bacterium]
VHNRAELRWKLANVADVSYFVVQKSRDSKDWENVEGQIPVEASIVHEYTFADITEAYTYYRLQSVSIDQRSSWSPIEQINCKDAAYAFRLLENPVHNSLRIGIHSQSTMPTKIIIYDMLGRTMLSQDLNIGTGSNDVQYPVSGFAKGSYQVQVVFRNEPVWQSRFVVN